MSFKPKKRMTRWFEPLAMFRLLLRIWATRRMDDQRDQHRGHGTSSSTNRDRAQDQSEYRAVYQPGGRHQGRHPGQHERVFDYAQTDEEFWFDYVADFGDAFDPTMCVAWYLGREALNRADIDPRLRIEPEFGLPDDVPGLPVDDIPAVLPRGQLLVMGGDQVYPDASTTRYLNQTTGPYQLAWEPSAESNQLMESGLLVLPANHDWYGGIGPFQEAFCNQDKIGGWRTAQHCTWWSARLAHDWWIWGVDTALDGTVNQSQFEYFRAVRDVMPDDARLIVCVPVPMWRLRERYVDHLDNLARFFFGLGLEPEVYLSGDYHIAAIHRRDRADGEVEWHLTDGGGGAFQHPVHNLDHSIPNKHGGLPEPAVADDEPFRLIASWPSNTESREGTGGWWQLLFDRAAVSLIATLAVLQLAVMALVGADHRSDIDNQRSLAETIVDQLLPFGVPVWLGLIALATFVLARASSSARGAVSWARSVGLAHGVIQSSVFLTAQVLGNLLIRGTVTFWPTWLILTGSAIAGSVLSIVVLGSYLRFANQQFRMHDNESYSARHSGDNRHFARFRISPDGTLSCYVVAFRDTGYGWAEAMAEARPGPPPSASKPELIDVRFRTSASDREGIDEDARRVETP